MPVTAEVIPELNHFHTSEYYHALLKAESAPHAGHSLFALPICTCGFRLDDEAVRIAVGLRQGTVICHPHDCILDTAEGSKDVSSHLGPGWYSQHSVMNYQIWRDRTRADIPVGPVKRSVLKSILSLR